MKRTYLEEDLGLIKRYFPGAKTVTLRTPFDLTQRSGKCMPRLAPSTFRAAEQPASWGRDALWTN